MRRALVLFSTLMATTGLLSAQEDPTTNKDLIRMIMERAAQEPAAHMVSAAGCDCETSVVGSPILMGAGASSIAAKAALDSRLPSLPATAPVSTPATFSDPTSVTFFGGYSYGRSDGDINWNGFITAASFHMTDWLAVAADVSGHFADLGGILDVSWFNFSAGPQIIQRTGRVRGFAHVLFGVGRVDAAFLGQNLGNETGFSTVFGGGVDIGLSERFALRVFQGDLVRLWDINGVDANLGRISFGVVGRF